MNETLSMDRAQAVIAYLIQDCNVWNDVFRLSVRLAGADAWIFRLNGRGLISSQGAASAQHVEEKYMMTF